MKTAISLPDEVFADAERLAHRLGKSRSQLYAEAVAEYIAKRDPESITAMMDDVVSDVGTVVDAATHAAARAVLESSEW